MRMALLLALCIPVLAAPPPLDAQAPDPAALAVRLAGMTAVTGYEQAMVDTLLTLMPGAVRDRAGSAVLRLGRGAPARLLVCPLDEPGFVVGDVRPDGYLTLHRVGGGVPTMFDQQLEGQRVRVWGRRGGVPGVVAVRSVHLTRGRTSAEEPFTADRAFVDLGAGAAADVTSLGVTVLSPVALAKRPHAYGDSLLAAPVAGRRASCAAVVAASRAPVTQGSVSIILAVEQNLSLRGLLTAANEYGPFAETLIVDGMPGEPGALRDRADSSAGRRPAGLGAVRWLAMPVRYAGTPVETVSLPDVGAMTTRLRAWIGGGR